MRGFQAGQMHSLVAAWFRTASGPTLPYRLVRYLIAPSHCFQLLVLTWSQGALLLPVSLNAVTVV
jgi:hypothetical protein